MAEKPLLMLMNLPMPIETPRLILRPVMPGDGAVMYEAKAETFADLHQWMPWAKELGTADDSEAVVREAYARFIRREDLMIGGFEKDTGRFVIGTGLHRFDWTVKRFEIGYWVRESAQGQGYAGEAANALTRYAFWQLRANAVMISHAAGNDKSRRVIEKLGFDLEGKERKATVLPSGEVVDSWVYSRIDVKGLPELNVSWPAQS